MRSSIAAGWWTFTADTAEASPWGWMYLSSALDCGITAHHLSKAKSFPLFCSSLKGPKTSAHKKGLTVGSLPTWKTQWANSLLHTQDLPNTCLTLIPPALTEPPLLQVTVTFTLPTSSKNLKIHFLESSQVSTNHFPGRWYQCLLFKIDAV